VLVISNYNLFLTPLLNVKQMKKTIRSLCLTALILFVVINIYAEKLPEFKPGNIAFTAFCADGNDHFAIVALSELPADTAIYFTDNEPDATGGLADTNEGILKWNTGNNNIASGTIIVFDSITVSNRTVSIGSLTSVSGNVNLTATGDALFAYMGASPTDIKVWLAGIQNSTGNEGDLKMTGLTPGLTFINFYTTGSPDGGFYSGARDNKLSYAEYLPELANSSNWTTETSDGNLILPISTNGFSLNPYLIDVVTTDNKEYTAGDTIEITWVAKGLDSVSLFVYIQAEKTWSPLGNFKNRGLDSIIIPDDASYGNMYQIKVSSIIDTTINAVSNYFAIYEKPLISYKASEILRPSIMLDADTNIIYNEADSIYITGTNLTGDIIITAPNKLLLSFNINGEFKDSLKISNGGGTVTDKKIYIKVKDTDITFIEFDSVKIESPKASTIYRALSATKVFFLPIKKIQTPITGGSSPYENKYVYTYGNVTATNNETFVIQDYNEKAPEYTGIHIYMNEKTVKIEENDNLYVLGQVKEINGLTTISYFYHDINTEIPQNKNIPNITSATANTEPFESVLIRIENAECTEPKDINNEWVATDIDGNIIINDSFYNFTPILNKVYSITGIVEYSNNEYSLTPRYAIDIDEITNSETYIYNDIKIYPIPTKDIVNIETSEIIKTILIYNMNGTLLETVIPNSSITQVNIAEYYSGKYLFSIQTEQEIRNICVIKY